MILDNATLEKHLKKFQLLDNLLSLIIGIISFTIVGYAFYYQTTDTLQVHSAQIKEMKSDISTLTVSVNSTAVFQGAINEQMKAITNQVSDVKKNQERIEDKIDKLILRDK